MSSLTELREKVEQYWRYPPREFERATGLTGIAGGWRLPEWIDDVDETIFEHSPSFYEATWRLLHRLNPELPAYVGRHVRDYALGVLSDINLDDLNHWALGDFRLTEPDEMAAERRLGVRIGWRPHPATLRKMLAPGLRALESQEQAGG